MAESTDTCTAENCNRPVIAKTLCTMHYQRLKKTGVVHKRKNPREKRLNFLRSLPDTDECIIWPYCVGATSPYGLAQYDGKQTGAHRVSLIIHKGPPPEGRYHAAHDPEKCNNALCVNPKHLRWATAKENSRDQVIAGTAPRGSARSTLIDREVLEIFHSGDSSEALAGKYSVSSATICRIRNGYVWGWLTGKRYQRSR